MGSAMELDDLFEEVTGATTLEDQDPPANNRLPAIQVVSRKLNELLNLQLPALLRSAVTLEKLKVSARCVDGRIIGTGEADFTKGNTLYSLNYKGKTFQL